jgi:hypothetical protein
MNTELSNFLETFPPHRKVLAGRTLGTLVRFSDLGVMTRGQMVEHYHLTEGLECSTEIVEKSTLSAWLQYKRGLSIDDHLRKVNEGKIDYWVNRYKVNKTVYDYAVYLKGVGRNLTECTCPAKDMPFGRCCKVAGF